MAGTWLVNVMLGTSAFLFTFISSIANNTWKTSFYRAIIGFILFFILGYILRFVLKQITVGSSPKPINKVESFIETDLNNNANEMEQDEDTSFQAIPLGSLHNGADDKNPKIIADTIRSWTSQNQEG
jgi:hypothetical protein